MPHPISTSPIIMSTQVNNSIPTLSHISNPSTSSSHAAAKITISPVSPSHTNIHIMSLHTSTHTPISPRTWPSQNILDDLETWKYDEDVVDANIAIDADREICEIQMKKEKEHEKESSRIARLFRAVTPSPKTSPAPTPTTSSPHLTPIKQGAIAPIPVSPKQNTFLLSPTQSPQQSTSNTPQESPRQSPSPSPRQSPRQSPSPSPSPSAQASPSPSPSPRPGLPPTTPRSASKSLPRIQRMYLDEIHFLQHHEPTWQKKQERLYQIVDQAITEVKIQTPPKQKHQKSRTTSAPSSPQQHTTTRTTSNSHSKTPPPSRSGGRGRAAIRMLPSDVSPISLPRQTYAEPSPMISSMPNFHQPPALPPIPEQKSRDAPPLPAMPSSSPPPVPSWTRRESAAHSMPAIHEAEPELRQVYKNQNYSVTLKPVPIATTEPPKKVTLKKGESSLAATIAAINRAAKGS